MTSFLLCYADVPPSALVVTTGAAMDEDYPIEATFYGHRSAYAKLATNATSITITYDLGTGNTRTVDHFILGSVGRIISDGFTTAKLQGSSDGSTWVDQIGTSGSLQSRATDGPDDADIIFTADYNDTLAGTLAAYRYWKVTISGGSASPISLSKIYFGAALDMGREPDFYDMEVVNERDADTWQYPRGHYVMSRAYAPKHRFTVEWDGVTDAVAKSFAEKLLSNPFRNHVFLYTAEHLDPLYDNRLVYCRILDDACSLVKSNEKIDHWDISAVFEEV